MMWPLMCTILSSTNMMTEKLLSKNMILSPEILNILMMATLALTINSFMNLSSMSKSDEMNKTIMKMVGIMTLMAFSYKSCFKFLIMMEMTIFPLALLILNTSKDKDKKESLKYMVILNTLGSIPFMMFSISNKNLEKEMYTELMFESNLMSALMMLLLLVKTPILMFHLWLTKVHVSASGNCSMILASIMIKLGTLGLFKFSENLKQDNIIYMFLSLGVLTMLYFSMSMVRFFDMKTLIAMSSVLHMAMMTPMIMLKKSVSMMSSIMMMTAHGLISYFLFYIVTMKYEKMESRSTMFMKSLESSSKILNFMMMVFMFLNLGLPPFMNFYAETMFLTSLLLMKGKLMMMIFGSSLLLSIMFTMQVNTSLSFSKMESLVKKELNMMSMLMFSFFIYWTIIILYYL